MLQLKGTQRRRNAALRAGSEASTYRRTRLTAWLVQFLTLLGTRITL